MNRMDPLAAVADLRCQDGTTVLPVWWLDHLDQIDQGLRPPTDPDPS